jgi:hypothetical protein
MTNKNFLKLCTVSLGLLLLTTPSWSAAQFEMGFQLGSMNPDQDVLMQQTFGSGFNFDFYMGDLTDSGFEYRFDIEAYSVGSHHPADAAYNGGIDGVLNERRACGMTDNCDPQQWWGNVERVCLKSKAPLYGTRSACDINRHHVKDVWLRMDRYKCIVGENT